MQANACYVFICRPSTDGAFSFVALRQMGGFEFDSNKAGNGFSDLVLGPSHGVQPQVLPWPRSRLDSDLNRSSSQSRFLPFQQSVLSIPFKLPSTRTTATYILAVVSKFTPFIPLIPRNTPMFPSPSPVRKKNLKRAAPCPVLGSGEPCIGSLTTARIATSIGK